MSKCEICGKSFINLEEGGHSIEICEECSYLDEVKRLGIYCAISLISSDGYEKEVVPSSKYVVQYREIFEFLGRKFYCITKTKKKGEDKYYYKASCYEYGSDTIFNRPTRYVYYNKKDCKYVYKDFSKEERERIGNEWKLLKYICKESELMYNLVGAYRNNRFTEDILVNGLKIFTIQKSTGRIWANEIDYILAGEVYTKKGFVFNIKDVFLTCEHAIHARKEAIEFYDGFYTNLETVKREFGFILKLACQENGIVDIRNHFNSFKLQSLGEWLDKIEIVGKENK